MPNVDVHCPDCYQNPVGTLTAGAEMQHAAEIIGGSTESLRDRIDALGLADDVADLAIEG